MTSRKKALKMTRKKSSENEQEKKSSDNDQLTGHFPSFFFNISRTNSKNSKVNQQSVLNL